MNGTNNGKHPFYYNEKNTFVLDGFVHARRNRQENVAFIATSEMFCFNFKEGLVWHSHYLLIVWQSHYLCNLYLSFKH